jgi:hypothetical protein
MTVPQFAHFFTKDAPHSGQNFNPFSDSSAPQEGQGVGFSYPQAAHFAAFFGMSAPQFGQARYLSPHSGQNFVAAVYK